MVLISRVEQLYNDLALLTSGTDEYVSKVQEILAAPSRDEYDDFIKDKVKGIGKGK